MATEKIITSIKHRLVSAGVAVLFFAGLPWLLNVTLDEYRLFKLAHLSLDNVITVNEFTVYADEDNLQQLHVIWDRCVSEHIVVRKNFELIQLNENGTQSIVGKTDTELIDFNRGCLRLDFPIEEDEWLFLYTLESGGDYEMIFQMSLTFDNGASRSYMVTSDSFAP